MRSELCGNLRTDRLERLIGFFDRDANQYDDSLERSDRVVLGLPPASDLVIVDDDASMDRDGSLHGCAVLLSSGVPADRPLGQMPLRCTAEGDRCRTAGAGDRERGGCHLGEYITRERKRVVVIEAT